MTYTEVRKNENAIYYYRVRSIRVGSKTTKKRVYLGKNLSQKKLSVLEKKADLKLSDLEVLKHLIIPVLKEKNIPKAGIFGSYARGENSHKSDVDIVIEPAKDMGFDFFLLEDILSERIGKKVDVVTYASLHRKIKDKILREEVRLYEER